MISFFKKKYAFLALQKQTAADFVQAESSSDSLFSDNLEQNLNAITAIFNDSSDIVVRELDFGNQEVTIALVYIEGVTNEQKLNSNIIRPLMKKYSLQYLTETMEKPNPETIKSLMLSTADIVQTSSHNEAVDHCLTGYTMILMEGYDVILLADVKGWNERSVEDAKTETSVRGPHVGFTENLGTNISMLRRIVKNPGLTFESMTMGRQTRTVVSIAYIKGISDTALVEEVRARMKRIDMDGILESGYIEQNIEDDPFSLFPTIGNSEKPDKIAAKILEGRAAILVEGVPLVLTVPNLFIESFQASEDYYSRSYFSSFLRIIRLLAFAIGLLSPAVYIALTSFNPELIPTPMLISMAGAKDGTPFPSEVEALTMTLIYEIIREAGVRLPRVMGSTVSIVGALVIGEAAVSAGILGAPMVIVISLMAISSMVIPPQYETISLLRLFLIICSSVIGWFGIALGLLVIFIHMCSLKSFGVPYLSPFAPFVARDLKDTVIRVPFPFMSLRPKSIAKHNVRRNDLGSLQAGTSDTSEASKRRVSDGSFAVTSVPGSADQLADTQNNNIIDGD